MHGRPRKRVDPASSAEDASKKIALVESLLSIMLGNHHKHCYTKEALQQNAQLLEFNPEVYTAWNFRKLAVKHLMDAELEPDVRKAIIKEELRVVEAALARNLKSYGAWYHRKWIINLGLAALDQEFVLLGKLLDADSRNFHGWDYRRFLVGVKGVPVEDELQYTIDKINENFSNYSAWHNRSALLSKTFENDNEELKERMLESEFELVRQAFFVEPDDQSGWFYHCWLLGHSIPSGGPTLVCLWPPNAELITVKMNTGAPSTISAGRGQILYMDEIPIIICFSEPVMGVDCTTVSLNINSTLMMCNWKAVGGPSNSSKIWTTKIGLEPASAISQLDMKSDYAIEVVVGGSDGIVSSNGHSFVGTVHARFEAKLEHGCNPLKNIQNISLEEVSWSNQDYEIDEHASDIDYLGGQFEVDKNVGQSGKSILWQKKILQDEIEMCRNLLELQDDSKWANLTLARLLWTQHIHGWSADCHDEILQLYEYLTQLDPAHKGHYSDERSAVLLDQLTSRNKNLRPHWQIRKPIEGMEFLVSGCLRLSRMSFSKLIYMDRLLWVQMLDLSFNKLRSLEGLEVMQLLLCLDISNNCLSNVSVLRPLQTIPCLYFLNVSNNELGKPSDGSCRFCFNGDGSKVQDLCDVSSGFSGMKLAVLEIAGNPGSMKDNFKEKIVNALPSLQWLDGERVRRYD